MTMRFRPDRDVVQCLDHEAPARDAVYQGWTTRNDLRIVVYLDLRDIDQINAALDTHDSSDAVTIETRLSSLVLETAKFNGSVDEIRAALQSALALLDNLEADGGPT
jgi:hypothetical protein